MIDTHCHLDQFADPESLLPKWIKGGLHRLITPAMGEASLQRLLALKEQFPEQIYVAAGVHPERLMTEKLLQEAERMVTWIRQHPDRIVAIGEVGLPSYHLLPDDAIPPLAFDILDLFLACAVQLDLPVILHAVHGSSAPCLERLRRHGVQKAVFHWLKAPEDVQRRIRSAGYYASVTPEVQVMERDKTLVQHFYPDHLLLETDGPEILRLPTDIPDEERIPAADGLTNSCPLLIKDTVRELAHMYSKSETGIMNQADQNAGTFFGLPA